MKRVLCLWFPRPQSQFVLPNPAEAQQRRRQRLAQWCEQFSPTVGWEDPAWRHSTEPESLLLDVTGVAALFGGEAPLVAQIIQQLEQRNIVVRAALADTLGAAWALARYACGPVIAKSDQRPGFRPMIVATGEAATATALAPLPLEALRLAREHVVCLRALGVECVEQLIALPRGSLAERFGLPILQRYDQAVGRATEEIAAHRAPPMLTSEQSFEPAACGLEELNVALSRQLPQLTRPLAERRYGIQQLHCQFRHGPQVLAQLTVGLYRPSAHTEHLLELLRLRLEAVHLKAAVTNLRLSVAKAAPLAWRQEEMFEQQTNRDADPQLAALVDRLSSRLGWDAVLRTRLQPQAQPEYAWDSEPVLASDGRRRARSRPAANADSPRPLRLLHRPLAVNVVSVASHGPPGQFRLSGEEHRVVRHWGPERIETGWWRGRGARRDYYCVETATGRWCWLFRQLSTSRWYVHGWND